MKKSRRGNRGRGFGSLGANFLKTLEGFMVLNLKIKIKIIAPPGAPVNKKFKTLHFLKRLGHRVPRGNFHILRTVFMLMEFFSLPPAFWSFVPGPPGEAHL